MNIARIAFRQAVGRNQAGLDQPDNERAGADKRIEDGNAVIADRRREVAAQRGVGAADQEIDDRDRRVHDPQPLGQAREGRAEKRVVEMADQLLARALALGERHPFAHVVVEGAQAGSFRVEA